MGPALPAKFGSRGKIQLRCFQGRRASLLSQRHKVAPLISATRPCEITCRRISSTESRDNGSRGCEEARRRVPYPSTRLRLAQGIRPRFLSWPAMSKRQRVEWEYGYLALTLYYDIL